ncbi:hypothetical protein J4218_02405 [Candidatus Pacearchaeota archaeon]|nr:hypothetical protein [Candidatus Pacearchaeota archaeon]
MGEFENLKKGWNIYHYYFTIVIFFIFVLLNYFSRNFTVESLNMALMISAVTFLFGFITNINFSMLLKKVHSLRDALAQETASLVSVYLLSKHLGKEFHEKIAKLVDGYTIYTLRDYKKYESGREFVYGMYDDLSLMEMDSEYKRSIASRLLSELTSFEKVREELEYLTSNRMEISLKLVNYLLGTILIILLFLNRGDMFTNALFVILSTTIIFLFLIVEDYDELKIEDYATNISNSEQIFDLIGKERYYPQEILSKIKLEKGRKYRIGIFDSKSGKEKIFELEYGKNKKIK